MNHLDKSSCLCSSHSGLYIPNKQLSFVVALLCFCAVGIFFAGYFFGKRDVLKQLVTMQDQEFCAESVFASLQGLNTLESSEQVSTQDSESFTHEAVELSLPEQHLQQSNQQAIAVADKQNVDKQNNVVDTKIDQVTKSTDAQEASKKGTGFYARVAGFGTVKSAQQCVDQLTAHGFNVEIKKRPGVTSGKKQKNAWYQVVTKVYNDHKELESIVSQITVIARLKDVPLIIEAT